MSKSFSAGWIEHPGTHCGHYFDEGNHISLCNREMRGSFAAVKDDPLYKCSVCKKRLAEPRTPSLFAGENDEASRKAEGVKDESET